MPFPQPKKVPLPPPTCPSCLEAMVRVRAVPLSYAPTFEAVYYRCEECRTQAKHAAVPRPDEADSGGDAAPAARKPLRKDRAQ